MKYPLCISWYIPRIQMQKGTWPAQRRIWIIIQFMEKKALPTIMVSINNLGDFSKQNADEKLALASCSNREGFLLFCVSAAFSFRRLVGQKTRSLGHHSSSVGGACSASHKISWNYNGMDVRPSRPATTFSTFQNLGTFSWLYWTEQLKGDGKGGEREEGWHSAKGHRSDSIPGLLHWGHSLCTLDTCSTTWRTGTPQFRTFQVKSINLVHFINVKDL